MGTTIHISSKIADILAEHIPNNKPFTNNVLNEVYIRPDLEFKNRTEFSKGVPILKICTKTGNICLMFWWGKSKVYPTFCDMDLNIIV